MTARRSSPQALALKAGELAIAAPQVVAHRLTRMAQSAASPTRADQREWTLMSAEKLAAFNEAWLAIGLECWRIQQRQMLALMTGFATPWTASYSAANAKRLGAASARR